MENDFDIEIEEFEQEEATGLQLPLNYLSFGELESDDVQVYIKQDVYKALEKFALSDTTKELGSILFGTYSQELGKTYVIISDHIEAKYTDASASTLKFTHETWDYIHKEHAKRCPELKIIGWQHTHPNYGIFLSNYDMFIQENFFNLPFQIAYVIDPIQNLRGFFQWKKGKVEKLKGYYVYDEVGKPVKIEQIRVEKKETAPPKPSKGLVAAVAVLAVLCLVLGIALWSVSASQKAALEKLQEENRVLSAQVQTKDSAIAQQEQQIASMEAVLGDGIPEGVDAVTVAELTEQNRQQAEEIARLQQRITALESEYAIKFTTYTVVAGDSLGVICQKNGLTYGKTVGIILSVNELKDPNLLIVGQELLIPTCDP